MEHTYAVIMAGGVGSRFWPTSTSQRPKQFLDILGTGESLLQQTFRRMERIVPADHIYIVTHTDYVDQCLSQLPKLKMTQILAEPARRNTAPCVAYAAFKLKKRDPLANIVLTPADHLVTREEEFERMIKHGLKATQKKNILLTLGITPHRPETGYGYIQFKNESTDLGEGIKPVKTFTEKPNLALAESFLSTGEFLWNAGIFIWNANAILSAFERHMPELYSAFEAGWDHLDSEGEPSFIAGMYPQCPNESIDYGILEKTAQVYVLPAEFGWSDLGSWGAVHDQRTPDEHGNTGVTANILAYNSKNNILSIPNHIVTVLDGLEDFIVIQSEDRLLICPKSKEQEIKQYVNDVKVRLGDKHA
ncbi:MAG: mannose-1-phosphate guanylyltransferase [Cryomorphaceae bacterium BACL7 MAG-120910-bin2]|jgi:mannose-1-phosphate guanylyltransferase|nr:MAG: mannose-1-phosphate guanylyltransferase [Cryomorphaceae bacterium BACL7 MAG-120910-bin2]KRO69074.1 MAG: mannose-1-phosphate guanylyltransferase [Cryomorphaceae bacterium BACL7 MAG-120322-bin74]KRO82938.1 MAG: mannose-1-phosphate guanylyltransferase [Cryomorphaceae bacterium BACL7 MAG-121220-bin83]NQW24881.1 mannose-1-phosphate guanylyltransferase [Cryomorphaceae bacterium]